MKSKRKEEKDVPILWNHDYKSLPIGKLSFTERRYLDLFNLQGLELKAGFLVKERKGKTVTKVELKEVSLVPTSTAPTYIKVRFHLLRWFYSLFKKN